MPTTAAVRSEFRPSCCGLFGLKATRGRNSLAPHYGDIGNGIIHEHVVSRSVRDSAAVLDATAGAAPGEPYAPPPPARPFADEVGADPGVTQDRCDDGIDERLRRASGLRGRRRGCGPALRIARAPCRLCRTGDRLGHNRQTVFEPVDRHVRLGGRRLGAPPGQRARAGTFRTLDLAHVRSLAKDRRGRLSARGPGRAARLPALSAGFSTIGISC